MRAFLPGLLWLAYALNPAHAIDPGIAQGSLELGATTISLTHAYAELHAKKDLRIVLADREAPQSAVSGIDPLPATQLAREGKLRGLLVRLDPADPKRALVTVLDAPADTAHSLATGKARGRANVVRGLRIANNRVSGALESRDSRTDERALPKIGYSVKFSAPLFTGPVVSADSAAKKAKHSPQ
jgi:hypothetical protein